MAKIRPTPEHRFWAKVTKTPTCWLWTAGRDRNGYGKFEVSGRSVQAHRYAYELLVGPIPAGMQIDHRTTCPKNCVNPEHLRPATHKQNQENRSGIHGVSWFAPLGKWRVRIRHNGRLYHIGVFDRKELAIQAVIRKRNELFTHNDADRVWPYVRETTTTRS